MELNCQVIRDLLPLYADGVLSDESIRLVEEHLQGCAACRDICESLCREIITPAEKTGKKSPSNPFVKIKKRNRKTIIIVSVAALICSLLLVFGSIVGIAYNSACWYGVDDLFSIDQLSLIATKKQDKVLAEMIMQKEGCEREDFTFGLYSIAGWSRSGQHTDGEPQYIFARKIDFKGEIGVICVFAKEPFFSTLEIVDYEFAEKSGTDIWKYCEGSFDNSVFDWPW